MTWTRAIDLQGLAGELESRGLLPLLVRKLIAHTAGGLSKLSIPAQEQIGRPGFDGRVEVIQGNRFVPPGLSVWEMGVNQDPGQKAEEDFAKRIAAASADTTFVFVTPRDWRKKDEWAAEKAAAAGWKNVVAYDGNDLEHWLEMARGVDAWISTLTRRLPQGLQSLETYWQGLSAIAAHTLAPQVFVASRDSEVAEVLRWLSGQPDSLFMRTASLNDGIDFLSAMGATEIQKLIGDTPVVPSPAQVLLQDAIVVHTAEEWRQLAAAGEALLLVPSPTLALSATDVATAVGAGHYVFVSGPRGIVPKERAIDLQGLANHELQQSLEASGFSDAEAAKFAKGTCGSSTILKRLITRHPETIFPAWSRGDLATHLAPFALVGGWRHVDPTPPSRAPDQHPIFQSTPPIDVDVVMALVGCNRDELEGDIARWSASEEPLFTRFGDRVLVTSREDAWHLLGHAVTDQQLQRFAELAGLVLLNVAAAPICQLRLVQSTDQL